MTRRLLGSVVCMIVVCLALAAPAMAENWNEIGGLAIQPDGKIIAAGLVGGVFEGERHGEMGVARYTSTGSLDPSFGTAGKVEVSFGGPVEANAVALQSDGKIVAVGTYGAGTSEERLAVARLNADGTLDSSFGALGIETYPSIPLQGFGVVIQPDGKILIVGSDYPDGFVARLDTDGALDTSFSGDGVVGSTYRLMGIALQSDGKAVVAGEDNGGETFAVARYTTTGTLDPTFGSGGQTTAGPPKFSGAEAVAIQPDGKILAAGSSGDAYTNDYTVVRYNTDGTLDTFFSGDGIATQSVGTFDVADGIALQSDGSMVVGGEEFGSFALTRFLSNGTDDSTFASSGVLVDHEEASGRATAVQTDGAILEGGTDNCCNADDSWLLTRYTAAGVRDPSFGTGGDAATAFGPAPETMPPVTNPITTPGAGSGSASTATPQSPAATPPAPKKVTHPKPLECRKGFKKQKAHGKTRCVKLKGKKKQHKR